MEEGQHHFARTLAVTDGHT